MAIFIYIDETGTTNLEDTSQPLFTLVAVLVKEDRIRPLSESLRQVAFSSLGWLPADFEFHGVELWHQNSWWSTLGPAEVIETYRVALSLLERHGVSIAYSTIHKANLKNRYATPDSPYLLALQFLCEKIDGIERDSLKVLVADESKEHELKAVEMVSDLQTWGSGIVPGRQLETVVDSLHFVRSEVSPGVQMADLVGFVIQRFRRRCDTHPDALAAIEEFRETIKAARITYRDIWPAC